MVDGYTPSYSTFRLTHCTDWHIWGSSLPNSVSLLWGGRFSFLRFAGRRDGSKLPFFAV